MNALTSVGRALRVARSSSFALLALLVLLAPPWLGCGGSEGTRPEGAGSASEPMRGGTAVVANISSPLGVNELIFTATQPTRELLTLQFLYLVEEQPDFADSPPSFEPMLAESWESSEDGRALTFHLRRDATWSDGTPVTAEDVRFTWQAQIHPDIAWNSAFYKEPIEDVEVVDAHTARFHFRAPLANQILFANEGVILPKHAWAELPFDQWRASADWFREHLVVNGPFILESWEADSEFRLVRNERYYEPGLPYLDSLILKVVPDRATQIVQLETGSVDFIFGLSLEDQERLAKTPGIHLTSYWTRGYAFVAWNLRKAPFEDPEVRRALTLAIDREAIIETLWGRAGRPSLSPIPSEVWATDRTARPLPYDPGEARRLLATKGFTDSDGDGTLDRDGKPLAFDMVTNLGNQQRTDAVVMIQEQLARVGIAMTPRVMAFNAMNSMIDDGSFDAALIKLNTATDLDLTNYHSRNMPGRNFFGYSDPEVDEWIDAATRAATYEEQAAYLDKIQKRFHRDQVHTFLWESQLLGASGGRLHGPEPNLLRNLWGAQRWWVEPAS